MSERNGSARRDKSETDGRTQELRRGVDYLYCDDCGRHVACIPLENDTWEVQCSRCVGECGLCSCRTARQCLGKDGTPVDTHMHVARSGRPKQSLFPGKEIGNE